MRRQLWAEILMALTFMAACSSVPESKPENPIPVSATSAATTAPSPTYTSSPSSTSTETATPRPSVTSTETPIVRLLSTMYPSGCCDLTGLTERQKRLVAALNNSEYTIYSGQRLQFTDGVVGFQCIPDDPLLLCVGYISQPVTFGDLNSDGVDDVAFILNLEQGASSILYELATLVSQNGKSVSTSTIYLDDRAQINDLQIKSGVIILDLFVHAPDDVHCCPTQHEIWRLKLIGGKLTFLP